jgi:hypothetical protein
MSEKIKIRISEDAYYRLVDILKDGSEYSHVRLNYKDGCCGSSKIEIYLDNIKTGDMEELIDELPVLYDFNVLENIKEITIVLRNGTFMIKTQLLKEKVRDCAACTSGCGNKGGCSSGCSGCKKDG